uniref:MNIO family bufferin maturase n=1 Tax=Shewanella baltica TaxID=62322 RepID=UPI00404890EB
MAQDVITQAPLGFGLGLRTQHFDAVLNTEPDIDWFEVLSENYMVAGGKPRYYLKEIGERYPLVMHGVSLSIGGTDPLNMDYLKALKQLANDVQPQWISDHICWTSIHGVNSHDLLPLPYTEETVKHVAQRIKTVQDFLGRRILMENVSSYLSYQDSSMDEWEFVNAVAEAADCLILLDINNIYVSARNHNFNPLDYLNKISPKRVQQFHLAGHSDYGDYVIDTHDHDVPSSVWDLYCAALKRFGGISTMIERDANIPEFSALEAELTIARNIARDTLGEAHPLNAAKGRKNMHEGKVIA